MLSVSWCPYSNNPPRKHFIHSLCNFFRLPYRSLGPNPAMWSLLVVRLSLSRTSAHVKNANGRVLHLDSLRAETAGDTLPLKDVFCFSRQVYFSHKRVKEKKKRAHLQLSVGAADFISLFIIHYSYELYFWSCTPSYIPAKDTFCSSLCAAMCEENEKRASCAGRGSRRDFFFFLSAKHESVRIFDCLHIETHSSLGLKYTFMKDCNTSIHFWRYVEVTFFSPFAESLQLLQTHRFSQLSPKVCRLFEASSPPREGIMPIFICSALHMPAWLSWFECIL